MKTKLTSWLSRPWIVMPLVAVVALGGWWIWKSNSSGATAAPTGFGTQVVAVTSGPMDQSVTADGTVAVAREQKASFASSGTVTSVNVAAGQAVNSGDVLATIDSAALQSSVAAAESSVATAQAKLSDDSAASASSAQLSADRSSLTSAQDQLTAAQTALAGAQLVAEFDGTVATVNLTVGQQLGSSGTGGTNVSGTGTGSGATASPIGSGSTGTGANSAASATSASSSSGQIVVVSAQSYTVALSLDASQVSNVKVGQPATVTLVTSTQSAAGGLRAFGGGAGGPGGAGGGQAQAAAGQSSSRQVAGTAPATGTVTAVAGVADASSGVAKYAVTVSFNDTTGAFNAGASVSVAVTYAQTGETLSVPFRAVSTTDGTSTVEVSSGSGTETRTVTTGITANAMVQITSGLSADEQVVVRAPGQNRTQGTGTQTPVGQGGTNTRPGS